MIGGTGKQNNAKNLQWWLPICKLFWYAISNGCQVPGNLYVIWPLRCFSWKVKWLQNDFLKWLVIKMTQVIPNFWLDVKESFETSLYIGNSGCKLLALSCLLVPPIMV